MTRILAVGDLHGETDPLLRLLDEEPNAAGLLCVGDWGDPGQVVAAYWGDLLARLPVLSVYGNHDDLAVLADLRNRDGTRVLLGQGECRQNFAGLTVAGVSGIWAKSHRLPHYVSDDDVAAWAAALQAGPAVDVLLTHGCPLGVADRTPSGRPGGQRCFLDLLKAVRPRVHLCGHLHVAQRRDVRLADAASGDATKMCSVLNTGSLRDGNYVALTVAGDGSVGADLLRTTLSR
jgi:Icc-related predicted phosphoesterase